MNPSDRDTSDRSASASEAGLCSWSSAQSIEYARGVLGEVATTVLAAGGPDLPSGRFFEDEQELPFFDELRTGPADHRSPAVLLADRGFDPTMTIQGEPRLSTLEPLERPTSAHQPVHQLGSFVRSRGFRAALQILDDFGPITSLHVTCHGGAGQGSLYARLFDAVSTVLTILGDPDMIDAMLVPPVHPAGVEAARPLPDTLPEGLSQLTGDLGALIRCQPRGLATISASDRACWERSVRVLGAAGTVLIDQVGVAWTDPSGKVIEDQPRERDGFQNACKQVAEEVDQWVGGQLDPVREVDSGLAIATCEATRLSCRTREPESTQKVRELLSRT